MQKHHKVYTEHFPSHTGYYDCEVCGKKAEDIHHIKRRSEFGKKMKHLQDKIENLIALCRSCHNKAHDNVLTKAYLIKKHNKNLGK